MRVCEVDGCGRERHGRSRWCSTHEGRVRRHGDPHHTEATTRGMSVADRYELHVVRSEDPDACWGWRGTTSHGYPIVSVSKKHVRITVWVYEQAHGPQPKGTVIRHSCDNPPCTNLRHLLAGSQGDNTEDMTVRDRVRYGDEHPYAKLTAAIVREARQEYAEGGVIARELAERYGVSRRTMSAALAGRTWRRA